MKEDAVSPVVAFMLLLMVIVSFLSLLNAYYIPSLKQQAEIEHLQDVRDGITAVDNDIWRQISDHPGAVFQESIPLGGGETIFSPTTSSGTLRSDPIDVLNISFRDDSTWYQYTVPISTISYRPIGNFWIPQGYEWRYGIVNVSKGSRSTWLNYLTQYEADTVLHRFFNETLGVTVEKNSSQGYNITNISIDIVQIIPSSPDQSFVSGNGVGTISIIDEKVGSLVIDQPEEMGIRINNTSSCMQSGLIAEHYIDLMKTIEADNAHIQTTTDEPDWNASSMLFDNSITPVKIQVDIYAVHLTLS